ncbi:uncharacterized protein LOC101861355 [Aplysia californica]|uniref:Uncharacterized protein LOC101861355 n=1 Tax=Aplysia californica TaxID=6500 RepID=A0ABM0ZXM4_APLCA|nr:uncharacterized protein LOC101861355 [Aplysia californica]
MGLYKGKIPGFYFRSPGHLKMTKITSINSVDDAQLPSTENTPDSIPDLEHSVDMEGSGDPDDGTHELESDISPSVDSFPTTASGDEEQESPETAETATVSKPPMIKELALAFWFYIGSCGILKKYLGVKDYTEKPTNYEISSLPINYGCNTENALWVFPVISIITGYIQYEELNEERCRLLTFRPEVNYLSRKALAKNGFYYFGNGHRIACYFCKRWGTALGDPEGLQEIRSCHHTNCPMVTGEPCNNIPLSVSSCQDPTAESQTVAEQPTDENNDIPLGRWLDQAARDDVPVRRERLLSLQNDCGIEDHRRIMSPPLYPLLSRPETRRLYFPISIDSRIIENFSGAGFFFAEESICCFWCGIRFAFERVALQVVDIWELHAQEKPTCVYLILRMGLANVQRWSGHSQIQHSPLQEAAVSRPIQEEGETASSTCRACNRRPREVRFLPCGHVVYCADCASVQFCYDCHRPVHDRIRANP